MSVSLKNGTIVTGGTAQNALPERIGRSKVIVAAQTENTWINFGEDAAADDGELIYAGSSAAFSVENFPEIGARVSIVSATTGAKYQIREV